MTYIDSFCDQVNDFTMHVVLISQCQKKSWAHSRRVLDSYARRIGDRSWATPITPEGLSELHGLLRSSATRQTAVACYQNVGVQQMKLLWIVGSKSAFSPDGYAPVGLTKKTYNPPAPWFRDACLLAQASGYVHDWGKGSQDFADKLQRSADGRGHDDGYVDTEAVRHEWLSYCLYKAASEHGFDAAWLGVSSESKIKDPSSLKKGLLTKQAALEFLIISHHKLLGKKSLNIDCTGHIKNAIPVGGVAQAVGQSGTTLSIDGKLFADASKLLSRVGDHHGQDYWFKVSLIARACLILADHQVSSIDYLSRHGTCGPDTLYANTKAIDDQRSGKRLDQPLDWHLRNVGEKAGEITQQLARATFDGLSHMTVESILESSRDQRFKWQDRAVDFLVKRRDDYSGPSLVLSSAGTGAGKTRANAKIVCALSPNPRFCVALNLRSLTLQTGDSLRNDLKILPAEMAVVIGDRVSEKMHRGSVDAFSISGEGESEIDVMGPEYPMPEWLKPHARNAKSAQLLMPPVLVSTIDFIINASEPGRQGHHALAMLRLMNSDLVLDELDSYDPSAMVAVLRLIQMSAMLGRNVVCSSATLPVPVASAVYQAFMSGVAMLQASDPTAGRPLVAFIDDLLDPELIDVSQAEPLMAKAVGRFEAAVKNRHERMIEALRLKPVYRLPVIAKMLANTPEGFFRTVKESIDQLHEQHQWSIGLSKELSFGLVRVANIGTAIELARYLSSAYGGEGVKIACYHSNDLKIQRHLKEKRLDFLLSRKRGAFKHIAQDAEINAAFSESVKSIAFIVIATPVEEVGRDHDFDWAVVEPSSAQSIVQTCGRVNRHRLESVSEPNIVLLDCNMKALKFPGKACFLKPGLELEVKGLRYSSQNLSELIGDQPLTRIDASFRLGSRPMAMDENRITTNRLEEGVRIIRQDKGHESNWMAQGFYMKYPLRAFSSKELFRFVPDSERGGFDLQQLTNAKTRAWESRSHSVQKPVECAWLTWDYDELMSQGLKLGIRPEDAMLLEVPRYNEEVEVMLFNDSSFGFMLKKSV